MKRLITIAGIIFLGLFAITLFSTCDIDSAFIEEIQKKIDTDNGDGGGDVPTYTVTYNDNGSTDGVVPGVQTKTYGVDLILALNTGNLVKSGYGFAGWNTAVGGSGTDYTIGVTYTTNADLVLYAQWITDVTSSNIGLLKVVPAGSFQRDSTSTNISVITTAYRMSEHEITRDQFSTIMVTDPSNATYSSGTSDPVQRANWYHAIAFCNQLSIDEGLTPVYTTNGSTVPDIWDGTTDGIITVPTSTDVNWDATTANWSANGYRLPTEMEWMWAAMGAVDDYTKLFAGSDGSNAIGDYAVFGYYGSETGKTTTERSNPVGSKLSNELGLYDMGGNVWEWNWDWSASPYPTGTIYSNTAEGRGAASGTYRVLRGGSWNDDASNCTVAYRYNNSPYRQNIIIGFRVVRP